MNRTDLLNYLIQDRQITHYLEIGVSDEQYNFAHIRCAHKTGVDPKPVTTFTGTSDAFFAQNQTLFGLVFIDGLHTETQVAEDINQACRCLAPNGLILLHDCLPPDAWHQREQALFQEGEAWNGQVWKAVLRFVNQTTYHCTLFDMDYGCGLIDTARTQQPLHRQLPDTLDYDNHFPLLADYTINIASYLKEQVMVFYHLACMGDWYDVFTEQMQQFRQQGFRRIKLTLLGGAAERSIVESVSTSIGIEIDIVFQEQNLTRFETPAMFAIEAYAQQHPTGYILYTHSKGVSSPGYIQKALWRRLMMHELVGKWENCVSQLPNYDVIGVNWRDMGDISHFCGNFWYATTQYIRQLADFSHYYENPRYSIWDSVNDRRLGCEFWIGSASKQPCILSLVCRNEDFISEAYWRDNPFKEY